MGKMLKVKMVKSVITRPEKQRKIMRGLGLTKVNKTVTLADTPAVSYTHLTLPTIHSV